jgi:hypothetical protein
VDKWLRGHDLVWPFITSQGLRDAVAADMRALAERAERAEVMESGLALINVVLHRDHGSTCAVGPDTALEVGRLLREYAEREKAPKSVAKRWTTKCESDGWTIGAAFDGECVDINTVVRALNAAGVELPRGRPTNHAAHVELARTTRGPTTFGCLCFTTSPDSRTTAT